MANGKSSKLYLRLELKIVECFWWYLPISSLYVINKQEQLLEICAYWFKQHVSKYFFFRRYWNTSLDLCENVQLKMFNWFICKLLNHCLLIVCSLFTNALHRNFELLYTWFCVYWFLIKAVLFLISL